MAKIVEDVIVIKFSKLAKDGAEHASIIGDDIKVALEQVAQELVGEGVIVEVEKA
jgi:hypothetical protein